MPRWIDGLKSPFILASQALQSRLSKNGDRQAKSEKYSWKTQKTSGEWAKSLKADLGNITYDQSRFIENFDETMPSKEEPGKGVQQSVGRFWNLLKPHSRLYVQVDTIKQNNSDQAPTLPLLPFQSSPPKSAMPQSTQPISQWRDETIGAVCQAQERMRDALPSSGRETSPEVLAATSDSDALASPRGVNGLSIREATNHTLKSPKKNFYERYIVTPKKSTPGAGLRHSLTEVARKAGIFPESPEHREARLVGLKAKIESPILSEPTPLLQRQLATSLEEIVDQETQDEPVAPEVLSKILASEHASNKVLRKIIGCQEIDAAMIDVIIAHHNTLPDTFLELAKSGKASSEQLKEIVMQHSYHQQESWRREAWEPISFSSHPTFRTVIDHAINPDVRTDVLLIVSEYPETQHAPDILATLARHPARDSAVLSAVVKRNANPYASMKDTYMRILDDELTDADTVYAILKTAMEMYASFRGGVNEPASVAAGAKDVWKKALHHKKTTADQLVEIIDKPPGSRREEQKHITLEALEHPLADDRCMEAAIRGSFWGKRVDSQIFRSVIRCAGRRKEQTNDQDAYDAIIDKAVRKNGGRRSEFSGILDAVQNLNSIKEILDHSNPESFAYGLETGIDAPLLQKILERPDIDAEALGKIA